MSSSRTLSRKFRTFFTCIKPRFDPSIILLYIAASVEQYCDITQLNALPENEGILEIREGKMKTGPYIPKDAQGNRVKPIKSFLRTAITLWVMSARRSVLLSESRLKNRLKNRST